MDQRQNAGRESVQIQVAGDYVVQEGVTEERALEIASEASREAIAQYTSEAFGEAATKIDELDRRVVDVFSNLKILDTFADPGFQRLLKKAQVGAACTDRTSDLDLLVGLLADRALKSDSRPTRASVDRAVEIVDQIDDSALTALSVVFAVMTYSPGAGRVRDGLDTMESLFAQLGVEGLPDGSEWLDHLDILGAIRINPVTKLNKLVKVWTTSMMNGYVCAGFENPDREEARVLRMVPGLPEMVAIEHDLRPGYFRLPYPNESIFRDYLKRLPGDAGGRADEYIEAAKRDFGFDEPHADCITPFTVEVDARPSIAAARRWWDGIENALTLTGVGKVLAKANLKRVYTGFPLPGLD